MSTSHSFPNIASPTIRLHENMPITPFNFDTPVLSIIAMKGHPFTRKTEFGNLIASYLGCPILSLEHVLHLLTPPVSPEREYEAFMVVCKIAYHQLCKGVSKIVVIDSNLSCKSHLVQLTRLAASLKPMLVRVIIIECKPMNLYSWKMKLVRHLAIRPPMPQEWYKPKNWEDVEKAIKDQQDYDETSVEGYEFVSKLVIDPLLDYPLNTIDLFIHDYHIKPPRTPRLVEAVKYMMTRDKEDGSNIVIYRQLPYQFGYHSSSSTTSISKDEKYCSRHGHDIVLSTKVLPHEATNCMACQNQVMNDAYCYCKNCSLSLHMDCAEGFVGAFKDERIRGVPQEYRFPNKLACNSCKDMGKVFSNECASCLFEAYLNYRRLPIVIKHFDTKEHFLTISLKPNLLMDKEVHRCVACGHCAINEMYLCKECGVAYHYECVTLPHQVKDVHGGHHHNMSLKFVSEEEEDYICQGCHKYRDPTLWFYSCQDCSGYELHPYCVRLIGRRRPQLNPNTSFTPSSF